MKDGFTHGVVPLQRPRPVLQTLPVNVVCKKTQRQRAVRTWGRIRGVVSPWTRGSLTRSPFEPKAQPRRVENPFVEDAGRAAGGRRRGSDKRRVKHPACRRRHTFSQRGEIISRKFHICHFVFIPSDEGRDQKLGHGGIETLQMRQFKVESDVNKLLPAGSGSVRLTDGAQLQPSFMDRSDPEVVSADGSARGARPGWTDVLHRLSTFRQQTWGVLTQTPETW